MKLITVDIGRALSTALGAVPKIRALRERIVKSLPDADMELIDGLEDFALALFHVDAMAQLPSKATAVAEMATRAKLEKARLMDDARYLVRRGLLAQAQLDEVEGGAKPSALGKDLLTLVSVFRDSWETVKGRTPVTVQELAAAFALGDGLYRAAGARRSSSTDADDVRFERRCAFTWFVRSYDESRRAVQYVRRKEGDANTIAPSIHPRRNRKHHATDAHVTTTAATTHDTEVTHG